VHVLQIEINRSLYMDERRVVKSDRFDSLEARIRQFISRLCQVDWTGQLQS
jgi:N-formylglutamate amidohydrolase